MAETAGTAALAHLATGDIPGAVAGIRTAARLQPDARGVVALARSIATSRTAIGDAGGSTNRSAPASSDRSGHRQWQPTGSRVALNTDRDEQALLDAYIRRLPKVELHVHLEGSIPPDLLASLARRNGDDRVPWTADGVRRWLTPIDYRDFLNAHVLIADQLRRPEDLVAATVALGHTLAAQQVRYAEVAVGPATLVRRGMRAADVFAALEQGRQQVERAVGTQIRWCATAGTRLGPRPAIETVEMVGSHRPTGVVSVGIAGLESATSRASFRPAFDLAASAGLHRVAHAGEAAGPRSVWDAVDVLGAERIGHGIRCLDDPALVAHLCDAAIPLEVCPTSNVRTGLVRSFRRHPLPLLMAAGLHVTLNTDDPGMLGLDLNGEYRKSARSFGFSAAAIRDLVRSGIRAAFIAAPDRDALLDEVDSVPMPSCAAAA